jgi:hypothetical protein
MTVRIYKSTDASAPVLTGQAGSLVALLSACLVDGYGAVAAAGWTKPFTATNKAVFRNSAVNGTGFYVNVDDAATGAGGAKEAFATGFQTMSAVATGTGQFPSAASLAVGTPLSGAVVWRKSNTADAVARPWVLLADDTVFYLFVETGDNVGGTFAHMFGDIYSFAATDPYRCMIIGQNAVNTDYQRNSFATLNQNPNSTIIGHFMAADWTGLSASLAVGKIADTVKMSRGSYGASSGGTGNLNTGGTNLQMGQDGQNPLTVTPFPNPIDGSMMLSPVWICYGNKIRGYLKGIWAPLHHLCVNHNDAFAGAGNMAGKSFLSQWVAAQQSGGSYQFHWGNPVLEVSDTWS